MIRKLTPEDRAVILNPNTLISGVKVFRSYLDIGLLGCKRAVEAIHAGRITVDEALSQNEGPPKEMCPNCRGTGFVGA